MTLIKYLFSACSILSVCSACNCGVNGSDQASDPNYLPKWRKAADFDNRIASGVTEKEVVDALGEPDVASMADNNLHAKIYDEHADGKIHRVIYFFSEEGMLERVGYNTLEEPAQGTAK